MKYVCVIYGGERKKSVRIQGMKMKIKSEDFVQFVGLTFDVEMVKKLDDYVMGLFWMMNKL